MTRLQSNAICLVESFVGITPKLLTFKSPMHITPPPCQRVLHMEAEKLKTNFRQVGRRALEKCPIFRKPHVTRKLTVVGKPPGKPPNSTTKSHSITSNLITITTREEILQKKLMPPGSQHHMALISSDFATCYYITILSINLHGPSLRHSPPMYLKERYMFLT